MRPARPAPLSAFGPLNAAGRPAMRGEEAVEVPAPGIVTRPEVSWVMRRLVIRAWWVANSPGSVIPTLLRSVSVPSIRYGPVVATKGKRTISARAWSSSSSPRTQRSMTASPAFSPGGGSSGSGGGRLGTLSPCDGTPEPRPPGLLGDNDALPPPKMTITNSHLATGDMPSRLPYR